MRDRIDKALERIERKHDVTVLFACESGSRAWGFPSRDSDWDVRFVYHHPMDWYLRLEGSRDVIEEPIDDLLDVSGWDLDKTLRLLRTSNPSILEWMQSPIVYREHASFEALRALAPGSFDPRRSLLHYLNMARHTWRQLMSRDEFPIKKYLYTIRPLLCALWVTEHESAPPMLYRDLLYALLPASEVATRVEDLIRRKQDMNESDLVGRDDVLHAWIQATAAQLEVAVPEQEELPAWAPYDATFRSVLGLRRP